MPNSPGMHVQVVCLPPAVVSRLEGVPHAGVAVPLGCSGFFVPSVGGASFGWGADVSPCGVVSCAERTPCGRQLCLPPGCLPLWGASAPPCLPLCLLWGVVPSGGVFAVRYLVLWGMVTFGDMRNQGVLWGLCLLLGSVEGPAVSVGHALR